MITPIRGRKLMLRLSLLPTLCFLIRNDNPDKGTETDCKGSWSIVLAALRLEMITPIRGRKPIDADGLFNTTSKIRNDNPDKGTET